MSTNPTTFTYIINTTWLQANGARVQDIARYAMALGLGLAQWYPNADISVDAMALGEESEDMLDITDPGDEDASKMESVIRQVAGHALIAVLGPATVKSIVVGVSETYRCDDDVVRRQARHWKGAGRLLVNGQPADAPAPVENDKEAKLADQFNEIDARVAVDKCCNVVGIGLSVPSALSDAGDCEGELNVYAMTLRQSGKVYDFWSCPAPPRGDR